MCVLAMGDCFELPKACQAILATVGTLPASTVHSFPTDTIEVGITIPVGTYPGDSFTTEWNGAQTGAKEESGAFNSGLSPTSYAKIWGLHEISARRRLLPVHERIAQTWVVRQRHPMQRYGTIAHQPLVCSASPFYRAFVG